MTATSPRAGQRPTDFECSACRAVLQSFDEADRNGDHVGCGGPVVLTEATPHEITTIDRALAGDDVSAMLDAIGIPADPLAPISPLPTRARRESEAPQIGDVAKKPPTPHALWITANAGAISEAAGRAKYSALMMEHGYIVPQRRRMPELRHGKNRTFRLVQQGGSIVELTFIAGLLDDGQVGEVFIHADQQGATISGMLDAVGILVSMLLQYGVPLPKVIGKLKNMRFPPDGFTKAGDIPNCTSPLDLLARWLETFLAPSGRVT